MLKCSNSTKIIVHDDDNHDDCDDSAHITEFGEVRKRKIICKINPIFKHSCLMRAMRD